MNAFQRFNSGVMRMSTPARLWLLLLSLNPGTRRGSHEVTAQIGQGGMGEVYRARDTKLNRDVALKVRPDAFASDHDRLAQFQREAQLTAMYCPRVLGQWFDGIRFYAAASSPRRSRRTWAGLR